jgi:hypothetical protein
MSLPHLRGLFDSVAGAVCRRGLRGLSGAAPLSDSLLEVAADALEQMRNQQIDQDLRAALQEAAQAPTEDVRREAEAAAAQAHGAGPVREQVAAYLVQLPGAVRRISKRPADPGGLTVPPDISIRRPEDLLRFLPARLPRFKTGDRPPGIGDWELVELLGVGGFGEVWLARNPLMEETAALKFCLDPEAAKTLRNEAALLARIRREGQHPGIVRLLDTSLSADPPFLRYEYVAGGDLTGLAREWQGLAPAKRQERAARAVLRLAQVVGHMHRLSPPVVHRDLKPANVLVQRKELGKVELRVTDFGIGGVAAGQAVARERSGTTSRGDLLATALRGSHTPLYASPQQRSGAAPDVRDDVHALGVIWYQLLTGDLLNPVPPDWFLEAESLGLGPEMVSLLGSCLAARPERRPADAVALSERLQAVLDGRAAPAAPRAIQVAVPVARPAPAAVPVRAPTPPPRPAGPAPIIVCAGGTGQYRTLREALNVAPVGVRILVRPGRYLEGLTLNRKVEITGDGPRDRIIIESDDANCVSMNTEAATVRGLTLRGCAARTGKKLFAVNAPTGALVLEDCDITSDSLACVGVHGAAAKPTLRGCAIHHSKASGVFVYDGAAAVLEDCDIYGNAMAGVAITEGGNPILRRCTVRDGEQSGVFVYDRGLGLLEDCKVQGNALAGVEVKQGGNPTLRRCTLTDILVGEDGRGLFEECAVCCQTVGACVEIKKSGDPILRDCKIHDGKQSGVYVHSNGLGTLDNCEITGNTRAGVEVKSQGQPTVRRCRVNRNGYEAVWIYEGGAGTVEDCDLTGNQRGCWDIAAGCSVTRRRNRE